MEPRVQCIHKVSPTIHILGQINPIPRIDTYFWKIGLFKYIFPVCLLIKILKTLLPSSIVTKCPAKDFIFNTLSLVNKYMKIHFVCITLKVTQLFQGQSQGTRSRGRAYKTLECVTFDLKRYIMKLKLKFKNRDEWKKITKEKMIQYWRGPIKEN